MRVIDVALFLFCLQMSMGIVNNLIMFFPNEFGLLEAVKKNTPTIESYEFSSSVSSAGQAVQASEVSIQAVFSWFNAAWKAFILIISVITNFIWNIVAGVQTFIEIVFSDIPNIWIISWPVQAIVWMIYGIGFAQWYSGRGFKEYM